MSAGRRTPFYQFATFYDPISAVVIPLIDGFMRRSMLHLGAQQRVVRLNEIWINYYYLPARAPADGTPPLLFLHGIADSAATWAMVLPFLSRRSPIYLIDLPGHGFSGLPADRTYISFPEHRAVIEAFSAQVIGAAPLVIGNSLGGMAAVRIAEEMRVRGVVLLNPGGAQLEGRTSYDPFFAKLNQHDLLLTWRMAREIFGAVPWPILGIALRGIQQMFQRPVINDAYADTDDTIFLRPDELQAIPVAAGLIWGMNDRFLPAGSREFFTKYLPPASRVLLLNHCGHLPQRERPRSVARFVEQFAAGV